MTTAITISDLNKTYATGFHALDNINLEIKKGEIFALLGPNGAGKTSLINILCGLVNPSQGSLKIFGHDIKREFKAARFLIGLVPQELHTDMFETVWSTINFSRGVFGLSRDNNYLEKLLKEFALWEKKDEKIMNLSGGMKRRLLIAKALAHQPQILFLDEPTAGVDVELRRHMWNLVRDYRSKGITIILTTHFIDEAQELADRIGIIHKGKLIVVDEKDQIMKQLGKKRLLLKLQRSISNLPPKLKKWNLNLLNNGQILEYTFPEGNEGDIVRELLDEIKMCEIDFIELNTAESSLEEIFVDLVSNK